MGLATAILTLVLLGPFAPTGRLWQTFQSYVKLSNAEVSTVDRDQPVSKVLASNDPREIAVFGMVGVNASSEVLITRFRDITGLKKSDQVLEIGKFSSPPALQDLRTLTLDSGDIEAIRACEFGRCGMKLSREMITRLNRGIRSGDSAQLFRQVLLDYVQSYLGTGNSALLNYADKPTTVNLAREFQDLLSASPYVREYSPELYAYLQSFPSGRPQGAEDFIYWSKESLGRRPVISLTHVSIYRRSGSDEVLILSKQIFASHYFDSSLGITGWIPRPDGGSRTRGYLFYLNRSRVDALGGTFGGVISSIIMRQIQEGVITNLRLVKERLERP